MDEFAGPYRGGVGYIRRHGPQKVLQERGAMCHVHGHKGQSTAVIECKILLKMRLSSAAIWLSLNANLDEINSRKSRQFVFFFKRCTQLDNLCFRVSIQGNLSKKVKVK